MLEESIAPRGRRTSEASLAFQIQEALHAGEQKKSLATGDSTHNQHGYPNVTGDNSTSVPPFPIQIRLKEITGRAA